VSELIKSLKITGMPNRKPVLKICIKGHQFYKSSDCPVCPVCEKEKSDVAGKLPKLGSPARRALENNGITDLQQLSRCSEAEILSFHGIGPSSMPILKAALKEAGLRFEQ
jgi:DNA-directed RNA polymerase alpha subunit